LDRRAPSEADETTDLVPVEFDRHPAIHVDDVATDATIESFLTRLMS
jgi:hypothetical protein